MKTHEDMKKICPLGYHVHELSHVHCGFLRKGRYIVLMTSYYAPLTSPILQNLGNLRAIGYFCRAIYR